MNAIHTEIGTEIPVDDVYKYETCFKRYIGRGLPPCHLCSIARRTACFKVKTAKFINNTEQSGTGSKAGFLRPEPDRVPTGNL